jgi:hypothetical protein
MNNNPNAPGRIELSTTNVLSHAFGNYKLLHQSDKAVIRTFILFLVLLVSGGIACTYLFPDSTAAIVLAAVFSSTAVSVIYSIFDRLSVLSPVENRISQAIADLRAVLVNVDASSADRAKKNEELVAKFREAAGEVIWYHKYSRARHDFGFNAVLGLECFHESSKTRFETRNIIVERLQEAKKGDEICYLISYIEDVKAFRVAVTDAVERGVSVRVMLMKPDESAEVVISRWKDIYDSSHASCADFVKHIRLVAQKVLWTRRDLENISTMDGNTRMFDVRFYTKSLNFPLIITSSGSVSGTAGLVAYTGFYANNNAEEMPFIEWRGGAFQIVERFKAMFESKWQECESLQDLGS